MILAAHDPAWAAEAAHEARRWRAYVGGIVVVHHIGSTAVPGLLAKPILDLMPIFESTAAADAARGAVEALGYAWMGPYGLRGRRYCRLDDPETGRRRVQAHGYALGHPDIARHLAFRNLLRADATRRGAYGAEKARCAAAHPDDPECYGACKSGWIQETERIAMAGGWADRDAESW